MSDCALETELKLENEANDEIKNEINDENHLEQTNDDQLVNADLQIEFSFGSFWNWFLPNSIDIWSSANNSNSEIMIAYGSKSYLLLADVRPTKKNKKSNQWSIHYRNLINVFGAKSKGFFDPFRSSNSYITTAVFDKTNSLIKHGSNMNYKINANNCAMLFLGNSDGIAALYDCRKMISLLQDLRFADISRPCCKMITQKRILSAAWLHYQTDGPVVYYSLDTHIIIWKVKLNQVKIFHDNNEICSNSRYNSANLQISCLASLPADCTSDKNEHKLAIGYMGGKIVIIGLNPVDGSQTSLSVLSENGHNDDICSLAFSSYSLSNISAYRNGLICAVSRDSILKVWSCSNQNEVAEHRINFAQGNSKHSSNVNNWFAAAFLPRSNMTSNVAFEIVFTSSSGELLTFTLPEKDLNSKLRIGKPQKTFQQNDRKNKFIGHTFVVFSICTDFEKRIAVTISLDYKLIIWDLNTRISSDVLHSFSNGALAIDSCLTDKRIAIAFGSNISLLDFEQNLNGDCSNDQNHDNELILRRYDTIVQRLVLSSKAKFFNVIWNRHYFERLGRLIIANSNGEIYHYDLNTKSVIFKTNKSADLSKIYTMIWLDSLFYDDDSIVNENVNNDNKENEKTIGNPVILSLHQSGNIMINYLKKEKPQENLDKYLIGLPVNQKLKHTAIATSGSKNTRCCLLVGNDDGTIDVFYKIIPAENSERKAFRHMYRFRSFNRPCLSLEYCSSTNWISVTALNESVINCYHLDDINDYFENKINYSHEESEEEKLNVKSISKKCTLAGHLNRVSLTCWSLFNTNEKILLASSSYDTTCIIWDVLAGLALKRFFGHKSVVYTIKWCHFNADYIFSGGEDNFLFWNWTIQPDYVPLKTITQNIKINSLKLLKKSGENNKIDNGSINENKVIDDIATGDILEKNVTTDNAMTTINTKLDSISTNSKVKSTTKALFLLSNRIENSSSKYELLEDIKCLIKLKKQQNVNEELNISPKQIDRILLYGNYNHIERMLQMEIDNHKNNKTVEGVYLLSLYLDPKPFILRCIENNECDPIISMFASCFSRTLFTDCLENILAKPKDKEMINFKIKWNNYSKELSALLRFYCLRDFHGAINFLCDNNLYREAIILSNINLAEESFISNLYYQWHLFRLQKNDYESAIKCLIASKNYQKALELLTQRRILCVDTCSPSIIKQYDELIEMLK